MRRPWRSARASTGPVGTAARRGAVCRWRPAPSLPEGSFAPERGVDTERSRLGPVAATARVPTRLRRPAPTAWLASVLLAAALQAASPRAGAAEAAPEAADPTLEARMVRITSELRCLVCQNQTIADSNAGLAVDLRRETRALLRAGRSDAEIVDYMTARYGDFVLYRPPFRTTTALLWGGPALMLLGGAACLTWVLRRRSAMPADAFEPDPDGDGGADDDRAVHAGAPARSGPPHTARGST